MTNLSSAATQLPFTPVTPAGLGSPSIIEINDPAKVAYVVRGLAFIYHDSRYGQFVVIESKATITQATLEGYASQCSPAAGCKALASVVIIRGQVRALLLSGPAPSATSVTWLTGGLKIIVIGPSATFTVNDALSAAEQV
jgi:hypothetical protein